jgi:alpha-amylase/alpha-mannosidase (GH57 family)
MRDEEQPLKVVLCWHMHQPDYRGPASSDFELPWVYLHAIKDYSDMAFHLEANADARAVVNFAPVLLEQLDDYARQLRRWLKTGQRITDPLLAALAGPGLPLRLEDRRLLIDSALKANEKHLINRHPVYRELVDTANWAKQRPETLGYLNDQFLIDLLVWYHLAWMGESVRQSDLRLISLENKKRRFNEEDRRHLIEVISGVLNNLIERYRNLALAGRVELSVTPYAHPIMPLFYDFQVAREAMPQVALPDAKNYPGGPERALWHVHQGLATFERHFGFKPAGCWPSEGAVSDAAVALFEQEGFAWVASGQQVLHNSLSASGADMSAPAAWIHSPYRLAKGKLHGFFRDDGLSDLIGFTYSDWHAEDAVQNLIQHLESIADATRGEANRVVSIIMDGENAWEYYPKNGVYFLSALYKHLTEHPRLSLTTFSAVLEEMEQPVPQLPRLIAGSWVYGTLSTWIGDPDKNRGWEMLVDAKQAYDKVLASKKFSPSELKALELQLATCEGSDWFWWFGDYNPGQAVSDFERLFRLQLTQLYAMLGVEPPDYLKHVFAKGSGDPSSGGVMRQNV